MAVVDTLPRRAGDAASRHPPRMGDSPHDTGATGKSVQTLTKQ